MRKSILAVAVAAATVVSGANAAGFYLKEQSVVGQGRAFAGSAAGTDGASAAYFNPAGLVGVAEQVEVGVHYIKPDVTVTNDGSTSAAVIAPGPSVLAAENSLVSGTSPVKPYQGKPVPNAHFVKPIDETTALGIAIGAPYGFSNDYGANSFNRIDNKKVDLSVIELTSSLAKRISESSSVSFSLIYQTLEVEQKVASALGDVTQTADGAEIAFGIGYQNHLSDKTTVGASYKSQSTIGLNGKLNGGIYSGAGITSDFDLPSIFAVGIAHDLTESTRLYADLTHYGWSAYEKLVAISDGSGTRSGSPITAGTPLSSAANNYSDTISWGLGIEHDYGNGLTVRSGIHIDPTPTNDTDRSTTTPDSDRTWIAFGMSKNLNDSITFDAAYTHIIADDGRINKTVITSSAPTTASVKAKVESSVNILSLGLRYKF